MFVPASGSVKSGIYRVVGNADVCEVVLVAVNRDGDVLECNRYGVKYDSPANFRSDIETRLRRMQCVVDSLPAIITLGSCQTFEQFGIEITMTCLRPAMVKWKYRLNNFNHEYYCSVGIYDDIFVDLVHEYGLSEAGQNWVIHQSLTDPKRIKPAKQDMTAFQEYMNSLPVYDDTVERFIEATWQPWVREQLKK